MWNLATFRQIPIPQAEQPVELFACDSDQSTLFALRGGAIDVFRVIDAEKVKPMHRLMSPAIGELLSIKVVVSSDDQHLFLHGWHKKNGSEDEPKEPGRAVVVIFDIGDLTK